MAEDIYMNFATLSLETNVADSTLLQEAQLETGMTPFSDRPWGMEIVRIEYYPDTPNTQGENGGNFALCTQQDLAAMPTVQTKGCIDVCLAETNFTAGGGTSNFFLPEVHTFLPSVLVATPVISLYFQSQINNVDYQSKIQRVRIGFMTAPMTQARWNEVAQTWSYVG